MRHRPEKWSGWIDANAGAHVSPLQDIHCWLETKTHIIDCTTGDTMGESNDLWPPLIYCRFPKHPREARAPGSILLWRNKKDLEVIAPMAPMALPLVTRAFAIYADLERSSGGQH